MSPGQHQSSLVGWGFVVSKGLNMEMPRLCVDPGLATLTAVERSRPSSCIRGARPSRPYLKPMASRKALA